MKIDFTSNYPVFRKSTGQTAVKAAAATDSKGKTDVVEFSRGQSAAPDAPDKTLASLKANIMGDIATPAGSDRIAELQSRIKAGAYRTSTDELVNAILGQD